MGLGINLLVLFLLTNYLEIHYILSESIAILVLIILQVKKFHLKIKYLKFYYFNY